jgi:hypothetical protein
MQNHIHFVFLITPYRETVQLCKNARTEMKHELNSCTKGVQTDSRAERDRVIEASKQE